MTANPEVIGVINEQPLQCPRLSVGASIDLDLDQGGKLATWSQADGVGQHVCLTYMVRFTRQWLC
jgi:hypothetical protein